MNEREEIESFSFISVIIERQMNFSETPETTAGVRRDDFKLGADPKGRSGSYHFLRVEIWKPTGPHQMVSTERVNLIQSCIIIARPGILMHREEIKRTHNQCTYMVICMG